MFSPSDMLLKYLNAEPRDIYDIVGALEGYLNADPKFYTNDFRDAVQYVLSHGVSRSELFQEFDPGMELEEDENRWDYDYYSLARVYLKDNFCEKRIHHVRAVAKKLYGAASGPEEQYSSQPKEQYSPQPKEQYSSQPKEQYSPQPKEQYRTSVLGRFTAASEGSRNVSRPAGQEGGQQSKGKKTQDQPNQDITATTPIPPGVKTVGLLLFGVVLVLLIVFIIKLG